MESVELSSARLIKRSGFGPEKFSGLSSKSPRCYLASYGLTDSGFEQERRVAVLPRQSDGLGKSLQTRLYTRSPLLKTTALRGIDFWRPLPRLWRGTLGPHTALAHPDHVAPHTPASDPQRTNRERIFIELMTSDRKVKASREGSA